MDPTKGGTRRMAPPSRGTPGTSEENPARRGPTGPTGIRTPVGTPEECPAMEEGQGGRLATATRGSPVESPAGTTSGRSSRFQAGARAEGSAIELQGVDRNEDVKNLNL